MLMTASTCFDQYGMSPDVNIVHLPGDFFFFCYDCAKAFKTILTNGKKFFSGKNLD